MAALRLAVLGDPLHYTRSPDLHRAGCAALGLECESAALRTPVESLGARLTELSAAGYAGVNLTHPLKQAVIEHLSRVAPAASRSRSVNTVGFGRDGHWGDTTDGAGFLDLLAALGRDPGHARVAILGAGGAARSLALALVEAGAHVGVRARHPGAANAAWEGVAGVRVAAWPAGAGDDALASATVVVNATPVSSAAEPVIAAWIPPGALAIDLTYGAEITDWVRALRAAGREAHDGLGLLVHQARHSLALWTGREVPLEPLVRAVGWPR